MALKLIPPGQRKDYRFYYVRGSLFGEREEFSTGTRNKRQAMRLLRDYQLFCETFDHPDGTIVLDANDPHWRKYRRGWPSARTNYDTLPPLPPRR